MSRPTATTCPTATTATHLPHSVVAGVRDRDSLLVMPRILRFLPYIARLFPVGLYDWAVEVMAGCHGMDEFAGRGAAWTMGGDAKASLPPPGHAVPVPWDAVVVGAAPGKGGGSIGKGGEAGGGVGGARACGEGSGEGAGVGAGGAALPVVAVPGSGSGGGGGGAAPMAQPCGGGGAGGGASGGASGGAVDPLPANPTPEAPHHDAPTPVPVSDECPLQQ